jgi:NAD(P)-dependent dehydrogenase (short-subunit alcohol dehydrogenase family)
MKFKKVAITGHLTGIGQSFYKYFKKISIVKGFDIIEGYDIEYDAEKIIEESLDCDLFINNACTDTNNAQAELASLWAKKHKSDPFFILQISSVAVRQLPISAPEALKLYTTGKEALESVHSKTNIEENNVCRSIVISPGIVDTPRHARSDELIVSLYNNLKDNNGLITSEDIVDVTIKNLEMINERYFPSMIEIYNTIVR